MPESQQDVFLNKIIEISKKPIIRKFSKGTGMSEHHWLEERILIKKGTVEQEYKLKLFQHYINTIRFRTWFAEICLQKIREECDNRFLSPEDIVEAHKKQENDPVNADFVIQVEYFLFAVKSILDVMARIVRDFEGFTKLDGGRLQIVEVGNRLPDGTTLKSAITSNLEWINELTDIRKTITHITIARFSSSIIAKPQEKTVEYNRRVLEITKDDLSQKKKKLPDDFNDIFDKLRGFSEQFFTYLNEFEIKGA